MRKHIVSGLMAILLLINLGGCSNMTKIQNTNNVIAGVIPTEITPALMVEWFNTKAKQADCKLSVSLLELAQLFLKAPPKASAAILLFARASRRLAGSGSAARCFPSRTTLQALALPITVPWGRALGLRAQGWVSGRRFST